MRVAVIKGEKATFKELPEDFKEWKDVETGKKVLNIGKTDETYWNSQGIYKVVEPVIPDPETQKKGGGYLDGNIYTFYVIDKTAEELEQEKIQKQKIEKEKIKQEKLDKYVKEQVDLDPVVNKQYYPIWEEGTYQIGDRVQYKEKLFENETADNTNAPDKGGWIELK